MVESLKSFRAVAATIVLFGYAAAVLFGLIDAIASGVGDTRSFALGLGSSYTHFALPVLAVVLTALVVLEAAVEPTPRATSLHAIGSALLNGLSLLFSVVFSFVYLVAWGLNIGDSTGMVVLNILTLFATLTVNVVCGIVGLKVMSGLSHRAAPAPTWQGGYAQPGPATRPTQGPGPVWQPEQAAGMSWGSAQDAAAGSAGQPGGGQTGWQPQGQPSAQQPAHQFYGAASYPQQPGSQQPGSQQPGPLQPGSQQPGPQQPGPQQPGYPQGQPPPSYPSQAGQSASQPPVQGYAPQPPANPGAPAPQPSADPVPPSSAPSAGASAEWDDDRTEIARRPDLP